jgi:hypothetical protein
MTTAIARIRSASVKLSQRLHILIYGRSRSTTRRTLLGLMTGLMIVTVIVFGTSLVVFSQVYNTADTVHNRTAPAILGIAAARAALVHADKAAISSFATDAQLTGTGEEFQNQIAIASQSLTRVARDNIAGEESSRDLQLIEGLLVTYTGLIGQADVHFRQTGGKTLGAADLWSASLLLHQILEQLDIVLHAHQRALEEQLSTSSMTQRAVLVLFLPIAALFALLVITHIVFWRRFRRRVNPWLVLAAVLLVALSYISSRAVVLQRDLEKTRSVLAQFQPVVDGRTYTSMMDLRGQKSLRDRILETPCGKPRECDDTIVGFITEVNKLNGTGDSGVDDSNLIDGTRIIVDEQTVAASVHADKERWIYILAILIVAAVFLGFRPRLYEYRYRPR